MRLLNPDYFTTQILIALALVFCAGSMLSATAAEETRVGQFQAGQVLVLRHANAPGIGDPAGMRLDDCTTQRNLDDRGREQARRLGERFRTDGLGGAKVFTSQWCRCRETARLLQLGEVQDLIALNSFFEEPDQKEPRLKALRSFLDQLPRNGPVVVLITHQVTITALTGSFPASGEGVVLNLKEGGGFEVARELEN